MLLPPTFPAIPIVNFLEEMISEEPQETLPAYWRKKQNSVDVGTVINEVNDEKKFSVTLDVSHFHPRELSVGLEENQLTVEGKTHRHSDFSDFDRQFRRTWTLPEDVKASNLKSRLSEDGHLIIEAIKTAPPREIPITVVTKQPEEQSQ